MLRGGSPARSTRGPPRDGEICWRTARSGKKHGTAGAVQNQNGGRERLTHSKEGNGHELEAPVCSGLHGGLIGALDRHGNHGCFEHASAPAGRAANTARTNRNATNTQEKVRPRDRRKPSQIKAILSQNLHRSNSPCYEPNPQKSSHGLTQTLGNPDRS